MARGRVLGLVLARVRALVRAAYLVAFLPWCAVRVLLMQDPCQVCARARTRPRTWPRSCTFQNTAQPGQARVPRPRWPAPRLRNSPCCTCVLASLTRASRPAYAPRSSASLLPPVPTLSSRPPMIRIGPVPGRLGLLQYSLRFQYHLSRNQPPTVHVQGLVICSQCSFHGVPPYIIILRPRTSRKGQTQNRRTYTVGPICHRTLVWSILHTMAIYQALFRIGLFSALTMGLGPGLIYVSINLGWSIAFPTIQKVTFETAVFMSMILVGAAILIRTTDWIINRI